MKNAINLLKNLRRLFSVAPHIIRHGGHLSVNVSQINYGQLLNEKRILITGGSSGIGLAIALKYVSLGARVMITGRNSEKLEKVSTQHRNPNLKVLQWDLRDIGILRTMLAKATVEIGGEFDILVNNAGVLSNEYFPNVSEADWENVYSTNSKALFFLSQEICRNWLVTGHTQRTTKKIINISSQGGFVGATYPYRMTKWDVAGFTQGLAIAMAPKGIIVNGIAPGIITTEMQKKYLYQDNNSYCNLNPVNRVASPAEIAELAAFLASDASNFIIGQTIVCDGGYSIK